MRRNGTKTVSIFARMMMLLIVIILLFCLSLSLLYWYGKRVMQQDFIQNSNLFTEQIAKNIRTTLLGMERKNFSAERLMASFGELLREEIPKGQEDASRLYVMFTNAINNYQTTMNNVIWIALMDFHGQVYINETAKNKGVSENLVKRIIESNKSRLDDVLGKVVCDASDDGMLYFLRAVFDESTLKFRGYFVAKMDKDSLIPVFNNVDPSSHGDFLIARDDDVRLYWTNVPPENYLDASRFLIQKQSIGYSNMYLVHFTDNAVPNRHYKSALRFMLFLFLATSLVSALFVIGTFSNVSKSTRQILSFIQKIAEGDFQSQLDTVYMPTELYVVSQGLNEMAIKMHKLLLAVEKAEYERQQNQYQLLQSRYCSLQAQINPHFLYNTLESINALAQLHGDEDVSDAICNLATFFRKNLLRTELFCSLREELDFVMNYLVLCKGIYTGRLANIVSVQPECNDCAIPSLLLQPIVENSVVHGMETKRGLCTISIKAWKDQRLLYVTISDNGKGMSSSCLSSLIEKEENKKDDNHIGIRNVKSRLALAYGDKASFLIDSKEGKGTLVTFILPFKEKNE